MNCAWERLPIRPATKTRKRQAVIDPESDNISGLAISQPKAPDQSLDRLCEMAAEIFAADSAMLVLRIGSVSRVIAGSDLSAQFRTRGWGATLPPYETTEDVLTLNAFHEPAVASKLAYLGRETAKFFFRTPVEAATGQSLSLVVLDEKRAKKPTEHEIKLLQQLKTLIADYLLPYSGLLLDQSADVTASTYLATVVNQISHTAVPTMLLDAHLKIIAVSESMARELRVRREDIIGQSHRDLALPMMDSIDALCRRTLETKLSPPEFEIVTAEDRNVYSVSISPLSPVDTRDYFIVVTARKVTDVSARKIELARKIGDRTPVEPSLAFLQETLVKRRALRSRKTISFVTLRSWRAPIRDWQIKALRALKQNIPPDMPMEIAKEMLEEISSLVGIGAFRAIVPIPCGHSHEQSCLSLEIARALAVQLELPVVQAFTVKKQKGSSHPKENAKRPPLVLQRPVYEPVLLVDDVATSGAHIEEAVKLLRQHTGSVLSVAWISGDSA